MYLYKVVLVSSEPWHGEPRDVQPTLALLARFLADPRYTARLSVVPGVWKSEAEQRAFGNTFLRNLPTPTVPGMPGDVIKQCGLCSAHHCNNHIRIQQSTTHAT